MNIDVVLEAIKAERHNQLVKWGNQKHTDLGWLCIFMEEAGEVAKAILEDDSVGMNKERIQAAAVLVAWLECRW